MAEQPTPQRRWQALCPGCGAPVEFASAASASAVCGFCRSTLVREGDALRRIGVVGELFDDHSPLQLGASGRHHGVAFTLVGRAQYRYPDGAWSEWHALFDGESGKSAWLSEDNGAYVMAFEQPALQPPPALAEVRVGQRLLIGGDAWRVASLQHVSLAAAEGELPRAPRLEGAFPVADLRREDGSVGTLEWMDPLQPRWSIGRRVGLADLALKGLREGASEAALGSRTLPCPNCGASLVLTLASTRSVSCGQCKSIVDVSGGAGADLAHYAQHNSGLGGLEPQIPLGRTGRLAVGPEGPQDWQVVGFQERCSLPEDDEDERHFWREYLLYQRQAGFAFLVDASDGWSVVRPITGVPAQSGAEATWEGTRYRRTEAPYTAMTTWVQGEFYWQVRQGEQLLVTDYRDGGGRGLLSAEQGPSEVTWSAGRRLSVAEVDAAYGIIRRDAPAAGASDEARAARLSEPEAPGLLARVSVGFVVLVVLLLVLLLLSRCDGRDTACDAQRNTFGADSPEYAQCLRDQRRGGYSSGGGGGSFGGFSSGGGGHK